MNGQLCSYQAAFSSVGIAAAPAAWGGSAQRAPERRQGWFGPWFMAFLARGCGVAVSGDRPAGGSRTAAASLS